MKIKIICFVILGFVFAPHTLCAKNVKRSKADDKDYMVINTLSESVDRIGDSCSENPQVLADAVEAKRVIELSFWLWNLPAVDKSEMIKNLDCFSKASPEVYRKVFDDLSSALREEIKNALKKQKEKGESNS